ncbi:MAG: hypothetical protein GY781_13795 [Gammaproteobacteria bacterium]|nr:hypothetical protein [Gammaproteobacteria bacterium]
MAIAVQSPKIIYSCCVLMSLSAEKKEEVKPAIDEYKRRNEVKTDSKAIIEMLQNYNDLVDELSFLKNHVEQMQHEKRVNQEKIDEVQRALKILNTPIDWG